MEKRFSLSLSLSRCLSLQISCNFRFRFKSDKNRDRVEHIQILFNEFVSLSFFLFLSVRQLLSEFNFIKLTKKQNIFRHVNRIFVITILFSTFSCSSSRFSFLAFWYQIKCNKNRLSRLNWPLIFI